MTPRQDIERIAAEHRAATDRLVDRIAAATRAAALRSAEIRARADEATPTTGTAAEIGDGDEEEPDRPHSWLV